MKTYEVLQHADDLTSYYVRNRVTGRRVVARVSFNQATETANHLELRAAIQELDAVVFPWPREIDTDTKQ